MSEQNIAIGTSGTLISTLGLFQSPLLEHRAPRFHHLGCSNHPYWNIVQPVFTDWIVPITLIGTSCNLFSPIGLFQSPLLEHRATCFHHLGCSNHPYWNIGHLVFSAWVVPITLIGTSSNLFSPIGLFQSPLLEHRAPSFHHLGCSNHPYWNWEAFIYSMQCLNNHSHDNSRPCFHPGVVLITLLMTTRTLFSTRELSSLPFP